MRHKPKTLADIQLRRKALRQKIEQTEAIIAGQFDLGPEKLLPKLDLKHTGLPYIARFLSLVRTLSSLSKHTKPAKLEQTDWRTTGAALLKLALPLLVGLLTKRFGK